MKTRQIRTHNGDKGMTDLACGGRVSKTDARIAACGAIDELNSLVGLARVESEGPRGKALGEFCGDLLKIQRFLVPLAGVCAGLPDRNNNLVSACGYLDAGIEALECLLPPQTAFVMPGSSELEARIHCARAVCRRAEISVCRLSGCSEAAKFLNRLSCYLFLLSRLAVLKAG